MTPARAILHRLRTLALDVSGLPEAQVHFLRAGEETDPQDLPDVCIFSMVDSIVPDSEDSAGGMERSMSLALTVAVKSLDDDATDELVNALMVAALADGLGAKGLTWETTEWGESATAPLVFAKVTFNATYFWRMP